MADIRHRIGVAAPAADVHHSLTTIDGLAGWWTRDVSGDPQPGGRLTFSFGDENRVVEMEVLDDTPDKVAWRVASGPDEWVDTTISYDLEATDGETLVRFAHADWRDASEFYGFCSTKWATYLLSLKHDVEGGAGAPYPDHLRIDQHD